MSRPRRHEFAPGKTEGFPRWEDSCGGSVNVIYSRQGTPTRWIRMGEMCVRCHAFWPDVPPATFSVYRERELERLKLRES